MSYIIKTEHLAYHYDSEPERGGDVLKGVDLEIERGSFTAIIGHNGSGKSTLAKLICAVLAPTCGEVYVKSGALGRTLSVRREEDIFSIRKTVGMVFQNPDNQLVATVVEEDVAFAPENLGLPSAEIRKRVDDALMTVGLSDYARHDTHKLSGGQKQRLAIAGVLAMLPECIIFDESTAMLDPKGRADILSTIKKLQAEKGITVILITHYMNEAAQADRIVVVDDGRILLDGTPKEVFINDEILRNAGLQVPQAAELMRMLYDCGADVPRIALDAKEAVDQIIKAAKREESE